MGANTFTEYMEHPDVATAHSLAHQQSGYLDGHQYSGGLGSTSGYVVVPGAHPMPQSAAYTRANQMIARGDVHDKWGSPSALPVCADDGAKTKVRTVRIRSACDDQWEVAQEILASLALGPGEVVASIDMQWPPPPYKAEIVTSEGAAVTRYRIVAGRDGYIGEAFAKQSEARARLKDLLLSGDQRYGELAIEAARVREDGSPLVRGVRVPKPRALTAKVTVATLRRDAPIIGWLFFGWAPS